MTIETSQPTAAELRLRAAGATKPCVATPNEDFDTVCIGGKLSIDGQGHVPHGICEGTGRVYVLPASVRVACHPNHCRNGENARRELRATEPGTGGPHAFCQGRSWVPNENGWDWIRATAPTLLMSDELTDALCEADPELAFFAALNRAIVASGGTLYAA